MGREDVELCKKALTGHIACHDFESMQTAIMELLNEVGEDGKCYMRLPDAWKASMALVLAAHAYRADHGMNAVEGGLKDE